MSRGAWILAALALGVFAALLVVMAKSLDTKAPIRIDRFSDRGAAPAAAAPAETPLSAEEAAAREEETLRGLVTRLAPSLAARAAAQVFASEDLARARCAFTSAAPVHREGDTAYWRLEYSCADAAKPDDLPNLTSVSVKLSKGEGRWTLSP